MSEDADGYCRDEANGGRIPVFKPTMQQFKSFKRYVEAIDAYGELIGGRRDCSRDLANTYVLQA